MFGLECPEIFVPACGNIGRPVTFKAVLPLMVGKEAGFLGGFDFPLLKPGRMRISGFGLGGRGSRAVLYQ